MRCEHKQVSSARASHLFMDGSWQHSSRGVKGVRDRGRPYEWCNQLCWQIPLLVPNTWLLGQTQACFKGKGQRSETAFHSLLVVAAPGLSGSTRGTRRQDGCALAGLAPQYKGNEYPAQGAQASTYQNQTKNPEPPTGSAHSEDASLTKNCCKRRRSTDLSVFPPLLISSCSYERNTV